MVDLANVPEGFSAVGLSSEFNSLADSIERMSNPEITDGVQGVFDAIAPGDRRAKGLREASNEIKALDDALTSLVASGGAEVAEQSLANLADQYGLSADQLDKLIGMLPGYKEALQAEANNADLAAAATDDLGDSMGDAATKTRTFQQALARLNNLLDGRANMRDYEAAIDDFTSSIKKNGNTFDITTKKGRENQGMLDGIVGSALAVAENMRGANRQKFLTSAIADIRTMAERMGVPKSEVSRLIELLRNANNTRVNPKISADTSAAEADIQRMREALAGLKDKSINIRVTRTGVSTTDGGFGPVSSADGSTVPKSGRGYADRYLYLLADGEEVISNRHGQADRHRPLLKANLTGHSKLFIRRLFCAVRCQR